MNNVLDAFHHISQEPVYHRKDNFDILAEKMVEKIGPDGTRRDLTGYFNSYSIEDDPFLKVAQALPCDERNICQFTTDFVELFSPQLSPKGVMTAVRFVRTKLLVPENLMAFMILKVLLYLR